MILPHGNSILVKMLDKDNADEKKRPSGLIVPATVIDRQRTRRAKILKCGPDVNKRIDYKMIGDKFVRVEANAGTDWKPGDVVVVSFYTGIFLDGLTEKDDAGYADLNEYRMITEHEIVAAWGD